MLDLHCAFATSMATPKHVAAAEAMGYQRAWLYDSPALYPDVWVMLARCADRTTTIGLGPGVLIPSLRHPMVTAAAIATLVDLAGQERVAVGVGTGFTGRFAMGRKPMKWADLADYVQVVRALLRGETTTWEGAKIAMLHPEGFGAPRPIDVPFALGAAGPLGVETARRLGTGLFVAGGAPTTGFGLEAILHFGTVLDPGEDPGSERVLAAAGHGAAVYYHFFAETGQDVTALPKGDQWLKAYADVPADERHLAVHDQHLIALNERDATFVDGDVVAALGGAYTPQQLRDTLATMEAGGATAVAYQPAGPDIERELAAFAEAAQS
jgi:5,10-methylenetetrahydromethanopterin reductase